MKVLVAQSSPTLCDPMDFSSAGSSVRGILQARILDWVAISFSRGSSWPRDQTWVSYIAGGFFTIWAITEILKKILYISLIVSTLCTLWPHPTPNFPIHIDLYYKFPKGVSQDFEISHDENVLTLVLDLWQPQWFLPTTPTHLWLCWVFTAACEI